MVIHAPSLRTHISVSRYITTLVQLDVTGIILSSEFSFGNILA